MNIIDYNQLCQVFSNSKDVHSIQYEDVHSVQYEDVHSVQYEDVHSIQYEDVHSVQYEDVHSVQYEDVHSVQYEDVHSVQYEDVHSVQYEDDRKWLKYKQVRKCGTVLSVFLVYCIGYFIKYFLVFSRLSTTFHDRVLIYSSAILSYDISPK